MDCRAAGKSLGLGSTQAVYPVEFEVLAKETKFSPAQLAELNICCAMPEGSCLCPMLYQVPVHSFDVNDYLNFDNRLVLSGTNDGEIKAIYSSFSNCDSCKYYCTPSCKPLRRWIRTFLDSVDVTDTIDPPIYTCPNYAFNKK